MQQLVCILPKSSHSEGRRGKKVDQDWYHQVLAAQKAYMNDPTNTRIIIPSAAKFSELMEAEYYARELNELSIPHEVIHKGLETIGQLVVMDELAWERKTDLTIIVTKAHEWRVKWICWRKDIEAKFEVTGGIPRPSEFRTDLLLTFAYPLLDLIWPGFEKCFQAKVIVRRNEGKL